MGTHRFRWFGLLAALPGLLGLALFYILPFFASLSHTFTQGVVQRRFVGLENFRELAANPVFRQAVANTAVFLALGIPLVLALSLALSVVIAKRPSGWQRWALLLPLVVPPASLALGWRSLWDAGGLAGRLLGMPEADLLHGPPAFLLVLLLYVLKNLGFLSVILTGAIQALPREYWEGYCLESVSETGFIRRILLPLISPALLFSGVAAVMNYFLFFRDIYALYGDDPPKQIYMLQQFMNSSFFGLNYQRLSAAAFLTVLLLSVLTAATVLLQRRAVRYVE